MTEQKINESDYTDRKGVVHHSIGENIRSNNNQLSADYLNSMSEEERASFPFFPFKKGKWVEVIDTIDNGKHSANTLLFESGANFIALNNRVKFAIITKNELTGGRAFIYYPSNIFYKDNIYFFIRFSSEAQTEDNGKQITMLCYVEDE